MKRFYIVEVKDGNEWQHMEFSSITKAMGMVSILVKAGNQVSIFTSK